MSVNRQSGNDISKEIDVKLGAEEPTQVRLASDSICSPPAFDQTVADFSPRSRHLCLTAYLRRCYGFASRTQCPRVMKLHNVTRPVISGRMLHVSVTPSVMLSPPHSCSLISRGQAHALREWRVQHTLEVKKIKFSVSQTVA